MDEYVVVLSQILSPTSKAKIKFYCVSLSRATTSGTV